MVVVGPSLDLVLAHEAARVAAVRACLCPEAWGECGDGDGQRFLVEDAALEQVGQGYLRGRNEEPVLAVYEVVDLEQVILELGQLAGALEHRAAHDERHRHFRVALPNVHGWRRRRRGGGGGGKGAGGKGSHFEEHTAAPWQTRLDPVKRHEPFCPGCQGRTVSARAQASQRARRAPRSARPRAWRPRPPSTR